MEDCRAGQSLEPDTNAGYNLGIAHYNWRLKSFSNILSDASCAASVPTPPQPPVAAPATAPAPSCTVTAVSQLQSTRQCIKSEGSMYITELLLGGRDLASMTNNNQSGVVICSF